MRIAAALSVFWNIHGYLVEGRGVYEAVLALDGDAPLLAVQQCQNGLGIMLAELGEFEAAEDAFAKALELARELGDPVRVGRRPSRTSATSRSSAATSPRPAG